MEELDIVAVTGHRLNKLGGYAPQSIERLDDFALAMVEEFLDVARAPTGSFTQLGQMLREYDTRDVKPVFHIGGAQGWDQAVWSACLKLGHPHRLLLPFPDMQLRWPREGQARFNTLMRHSMSSGLLAEPVRYKLDRTPRDANEATRALYDRNGDIAEGCIFCLTLWNGDLSGGTAHALRLIESMPTFPVCVETVDSDMSWPSIYNCWEEWMRLTRKTR